MNRSIEAVGRRGKVALRVALIVLVAAFGGLALLGMWPIPADLPVAGASIGSPGGGGLRRAFPAMNERAANLPSPQKVELGRLLFFDPVVSGDNTQSCATCHHPDLGFSDGRILSMGAGGKGTGPERSGGSVTRRNSPTLWNAGYNFKLFWDGRADDLEDQARGPITSAVEMNQDATELVRELKAIPEYVRLFDAAFAGENGSAITFDNVTNAIGIFERTLVSRQSPFDRYAAGEATALTAAQRRGLTLFRSLKTRCFECHGFPTFANPDFKVIGVPPLPGQAEDAGRGEIAGGEPYRHAFKVPTLRNVALTAPYMHNGRLQTLEEVISFYAGGGGKGTGLDLPNLDDKIRQFTLSPAEQADLISFLHALTDESAKPEIPSGVPSGLPVVTHLAPTAKGTMVAAPAAAANRAKPTAPREPMTWRVKSGRSIQAVLDQTVPGDTIEVEPGVYRESLLVDIDRITLRGLKIDGRRAVLDGGNELTDAVITSSHDFTIEGFGLKDYVNNGITVHGGRNSVFRDLEVVNTGLYGLYPVECDGVLIEDCTVSAIRDAGIYVGQSRNIIVRRNHTHHNVTGIEIENSVNALVEKNDVHDNTGGILVFLLPNNPSKVGTDTRVIGNRIANNNHPNFGDPTAIVGRVIPGTGMLIMAADRTEVTGNEITGNDTFGIGVVGLAIAFPKGRQFDVGAIPEGNRIYGNSMSGNGRKPGGLAKEIGLSDCDLFWDGSGWDNSWQQPGARSFPLALPGDGWPNLLRRSYSIAYSWIRDRLL
ncbi:MAG: parallel beta-helix domain-containing protein [Blastocatellia bacterium]